MDETIVEWTIRDAIERLEKIADIIPDIAEKDKDNDIEFFVHEKLVPIIKLIEQEIGYIKDRT